jgi:hypothetical protein
MIALYSRFRDLLEVTNSVADIAARLRQDWLWNGRGISCDSGNRGEPLMTWDTMVDRAHPGLKFGRPRWLRAELRRRPRIVVIGAVLNKPSLTWRRSGATARRVHPAPAIDGRLFVATLRPTAERRPDAAAPSCTRCPADDAEFSIRGPPSGPRAMREGSRSGPALGQQGDKIFSTTSGGLSPTGCVGQPGTYPVRSRWPVNARHNRRFQPARLT